MHSNINSRPPPHSLGAQMAPEPRTFRLIVAHAATLAVAALALVGCGGSSAPAPKVTSAPPSSLPSAPAATVTAQAVTKGKPTQASPPGYQWVGLTAQHYWLAVPDSWFVLNLSDISVPQAMERARLRQGLRGYVMRSDIEELHQVHGLVAMDVASIAASPSKFATNLNAYCGPSLIQPGVGAASALAASARAEVTQLAGHLIAIDDITNTASSVVMRVVADEQTSAGVTLRHLQYFHLTDQGRICYTTFTTDQPGRYSPLFATIAATIHVG